LNELHFQEQFCIETQEFSFITDEKEKWSGTGKKTDMKTSAIE
jgi:hypothetical protein